MLTGPDNRLASRGIEGLGVGGGGGRKADGCIFAVKYELFIGTAHVRSMKSILITKVDQKYKFMFNTYSNCIRGEPKPVSRLGKQCNATAMKAVGWKGGGQ